MKAQELADILLLHPEWDVYFEDFHFGGAHFDVEAEDILQPDGSGYGNGCPEKTFLIQTPYQGPGEPDY